MVYLLFALALLLVWWLIDRSLKKQFLPYLKWPALIMIAILASVDIFYWVETDRLINAHECCSACNTTQQGLESSCSQCCISYTSPGGSCTLNNIIINHGVYVSGNESTLAFADNNYYVVMNNVANSGTYNLTANYTCTSAPNMLYFKGRSDMLNRTKILINNTATGLWNTLYSFDASATDYVNNADVSGISVLNADNTVLVQVETTDSSINTAYLYLDELKLTNPITNKMYCSNTTDTGSIMAYHYAEYEIMPLFVNMLPYIAIAVGFGMVIQYILFLYKTAQYGSEYDNEDGLDESRRKGNNNNNKE